MLLEVLVAMVILAAAGLGLMELAAANIRSMDTARGREAELAREERLLVAHSLLTKRDLDQRLGNRQVGEYVISVQRPEPGLYRIAVGRVDAFGVEDLVTVVYRGEAHHGS